MKSRFTKAAILCLIRISWILLLLPVKAAMAQVDIAAGEEIFQTSCFACHSIGEGQRVGPDLIDVHSKRSQDWLERFVLSPKAVFDSGDADAVALFGEFNGIVMPDSPISAAQVVDVLAYIGSRSDAPAVASTSTSTTTTSSAPAIEDIAEGGDLFQGIRRFENSGPACNACHDVRNDTVTGGGALAAELTSVFSRMGAAGLTAILARAPFPAMQSAYNEKPLAESEIASLVAFFQYADAESESQQETNYGFRLFSAGAMGAVFLFGLIPFIWRRRKVGSVNQEIYDRQNKYEQT
jgi:cytochrome c2